MLICGEPREKAYQPISCRMWDSVELVNSLFSLLWFGEIDKTETAAGPRLFPHHNRRSNLSNLAEDLLQGLAVHLHNAVQSVPLKGSWSRLCKTLTDILLMP